MTLGQTLVAARKGRGWRLVDAAVRLRVSKGRLSLWEHDQNTPRKRNLKKIAKTYQLEYSELVRLAASGLYL